MHRRRFFVTAGTLTLAAIAGCSGDDEGDAAGDGDAEEDNETDDEDTDGDDESDDAASVPQAVFSWNYDSAGTELEITHDGGAAFEADRVVIAGPSPPSSAEGKSWAELSDNVDSGDSVAAGEWITIENVPSDAEIELHWVAPDGSEEILGDWAGPDA